MSSAVESDDEYKSALILITGWNRYNSTKSTFPKVILPIITEYYFNPFKWDKSLYENGLHVQNVTNVDKSAKMTFSNNDKTVQTHEYSTNYYCPSDQILSKDVHSFVKWK